MTSPSPEWFKRGRPNLEDDRWLLWLIAWFPLFFVVVSLCIKIVAPDLYAYSYREDGILEWSTALAFVAAGGFASLLAVRLRRDRRTVLALLYAGLAAGMVFAAMEEISWGQRVLNLEPSEFFVEHSTKEEINVHNLKQFPLGLAFVAVGFYGTFSRLLVPGSVRRRFPFAVELLTPPYAISVYFLPTFLLFTYLEYVFYNVMGPLGLTLRRDYMWEGHFIIAKDQEPIELLLAIGFLVFILNNWQRHKARKRAARATPEV